MNNSKGRNRTGIKAAATLSQEAFYKFSPLGSFRKTVFMTVAWSFTLSHSFIISPDVTNRSISLSAISCSLQKGKENDEGNYGFHLCIKIMNAHNPEQNENNVKLLLFPL